MTRFTVGSLLMLVGCGGPARSAADIREPLEARCNAAALAGCPVLVEGVVQYVAKNHGAAGKNFQLAADVNDADKLRAFIASEKIVAASKANETALEISAALDSLANLAKAPEPTMTSAATEGSSAPSRTRSGRVLATATGGQPCKKKKGDDAPCLQQRAVIGPITITDIESPGGCADELLVFVGEAYDPEWVVSTTTRLATRGGSYSVPESQAVWVASRGKPGQPLSTADACVVSWKGMR